MNRQEKEQFISYLHADLSNANIVIVTHNLGLTVAEMTDLRKKVRELGAKMKVTKNKLAKLALEKTEYKHIEDLFTGPTAIVYSEDMVAAAKAIVEFAKDNEKIQIIGGALESKKAELSDIQALAKLPSLDELRAKLVGMLSTPATRIAGVLQAPASQLARVMDAYSKQQ